MNTETNYPLTANGIEAANDADYASTSEVGRIDRLCRIVAGMSVLTVMVSGQIAVPGAIFTVSVLGCYLILTAIMGLDPFYALVGNHLWKRLASVSALSLAAVLSGQIFVPEVITVLGFIGAITGLAAIQQAGPLAMDSEEVQPVPADTTARGVGPVSVEGFESEQEGIAARRAA